jgi:tetratricopeptide (TPR) repeat protein
MKRWLKILAVFALAALAISSCGPSKEQLKRQEEAERELGKQYYVAGDYTSALRHLLEAEKFYADDHILQNYLGQTYLRKGSYELSIKHFEKALALKPDYAVARNNLGAVYVKMKEWDKAIEVLNELTGDLLYATPHYPQFNLGRAYYGKKQYRLAEEHFKRALEMEPEYSQALLWLGLTYLATGRNDEAVAALSSAVEISPNFAQAQYDLGRAYLKLRNYRKAKEAFGKAAVLSPDSDIGRNAKRMLEHLKHVR